MLTLLFLPHLLFFKLHLFKVFILLLYVTKLALMNKNKSMHVCVYSFSLFKFILSRVINFVFL